MFTQTALGYDTSNESLDPELSDGTNDMMVHVGMSEKCIMISQKKLFFTNIILF